MLRVKIVGGLIILASALVAVSVVQAHTSARSASSPSVGSTVDLTSLGSFDITFNTNVSDNPSVQQGQAVTTALAHSFGATDSSGALLPGVTVNAQYGIFTDNKMTVEAAGSDHQTLEYQGIGAWIVTFTGIGVGGGAQGGPAQLAGVVQPAPTTPSTEAVVVNATSGAPLLTLD